jgi:hypothetical protein
MSEELTLFSADGGFADTYVGGIRSADDIVYRILDE